MPRKRAKTRRSAIFLDRDGTINKPPKHRYITRWEEFEFIPGALRALRRLNARKQLVIIISNQSGVARGILSRTTLEKTTRKMLKSIRQSGGRVHAVYYCTHHPDNSCACRKPHIGMLKKAARRFSIDLKRSFVVGDTEADVLMARSAGCRKVLVLTGRRTRQTARQLLVPPDRIVKDLEQAVRWILHQQAKEQP